MTYQREIKRGVKVIWLNQDIAYGPYEFLYYLEERSRSILCEIGNINKAFSVATENVKIIKPS